MNGGFTMEGESYRDYRDISLMLNCSLVFKTHTGTGRDYFSSYWYDLYGGSIDVIGGGWGCRYNRL